jgi:hypothetical protein
MSDEFLIVPYRVRAAGTDVPPEEVQAAINSLAQQVTIALNDLDTGAAPSGPAGGDLGGTYPNPTVVALHVTSGTESGVAITGSTVDSTPLGATTPSTVAGTSVFAGGGAVPAVTATGTQVYNSPNPTVQFIDSIRSANNKNAFVTWGSTVLAFGFANDAFTSFTNALTITGGQAAGISGITSSSGTGVWAHTGGFSASGGINSTAIGATTASTGAFTTLTSTGGAFNGTVGATTPSTGAFTTVTATTPVGVASGGTGRSTLLAHGVLVGEGTAGINQLAVGNTGQMLLGSSGADPGFGNNPIITGGTINSTPVGATTPSTGAFTTLSATGAVTGIPGRLLAVQRFTASGTYTPTAGTNTAIIEGCGGGGGGGGAAATTAAQIAPAGPGAAGSWGRAQISAPTTQTVTIGGAGGGGAAGANAGSAGTQTSIGTYLVCPGGGGGPAGAAVAFANNQTFTGPGTPGAAATSSGTLLYGAAGAAGQGSFNSYNAAGGAVSVGGSGPYGAGGFSVGGSASAAGTGFGAGGNGPFNSASVSATAGGNGTAGFLLVYEYA